MARANPHAKSFIEHFSDPANRSEGGLCELKEEVMVLFNGPNQHYVTPKFYVETKPATGKVVPTWNYSAAQAYGQATFYLDSNAPETKDYLLKQISDLSEHAEGGYMKYQKTWKVTDAPERYIELLCKSIIGFEIKVSRLEGKFKMSQELKDGDREGVIKGFTELGNKEMAETVRKRAEFKKQEETAKRSLKP